MTSLPYYVSYAFGDAYKGFPTLDEAIAFALTRPHDVSVQVCGDGAEGGYGDDGSGWRDGLTDAERERVEEVLS
jgi:hypothetical protein